MEQPSSVPLTSLKRGIANSSTATATQMLTGCVFRFVEVFHTEDGATSGAFTTMVGDHFFLDSFCCLRHSHGGMGSLSAHRPNWDAFAVSCAVW